MTNPFPAPVMSGPELMRFIGEVFPAAMDFGFDIEQVESGRVVLSLTTDAARARPGGTVSGPDMMTLADTAMWALTLAHVGPEPMTVTANLSIHFLRRPEPGTLFAEATLLKLGGRLVVGEVAIRGQGDAAPVAHATVTYSVPPPHKRAGRRQE